MLCYPTHFIINTNGFRGLYILLHSINSHINSICLIFRLQHFNANRNPDILVYVRVGVDMFENLHNFPLLYNFGLVVGILISVYCCPLFSCFAYNNGEKRTMFFSSWCIRIRMTASMTRLLYHEHYYQDFSENNYVC